MRHKLLQRHRQTSRAAPSVGFILGLSDGREDFFFPSFVWKQRRLDVDISLPACSRSADTLPVRRLSESLSGGGGGGGAGNKHFTLGCSQVVCGRIHLVSREKSSAATAAPS